MVVVDTSVWSLALRRGEPGSAAVDVLKRLIAEDRVLMLGAIRQEILSGVRHQEQFERLRDRLRAFLDLALVRDDFELAAEFFNRCVAAMGFKARIRIF